MQEQTITNKQDRIKSLFVRPEIGVTVGLLVIWSIFALLSPMFLTAWNIGSIFTQAAEMGIIAVGMAFLLISGELDLSVGSVFVVAPMIMLRLTLGLNIPLPISFLLGILAAGLIGAFNGYITIRFKLPSFIVTLATMMLISGIILAVTGGFITEYSGKPLFFLILAGQVDFFRVSTIWMLLIVLFFHFILNYTLYGNWVFGTGGNQFVTRKMGIDTDRVKLKNFIISSILAGFAGCIAAARVNSVNPTVGFELMFNAMASAIIGGCLITGGHGSIVGTFLGVMLLSSVNSGLILAGASPYWYRAFVGAIILAVVIINLFVVDRGKGRK